MSEWPIQTKTKEKPAYTEKQIWSFYDEYKTPGIEHAVARPDIGSFHHISDETKRKDQDLLQQKMNRPHLRQQNEEGPDAFAFENFLTSEAMGRRWMGGELSPTSNYDDWVSGVDAVAEWTDETGEPVRLAIDFTSTKKTAVLLKKSDKLESNIQVKYLRSRVEMEDGRSKELRASMPTVLLGVDTPVFRLISERRDALTHEHPLRRLLVEQAASQIDLQTVLLVQKTFESARVRRGKGLKEARERYVSLGNEPTAEQAIDLVQGLDAEVLNAVMNEKDQQRFKDLIRLKAVLGAEREAARDIKLDAEWKAAAEGSLTHRILSGQQP